MQIITFYVELFSELSNHYGEPYLTGVLDESGKTGLKDLTLNDCRKYYNNHIKSINKRCAI